MHCLIVDDEAISRKFLEHFIGELDYLILSGCSQNAQEAEELLKSQKIDLIFLDVEMPQKSGLQFLDELSIKPLIILVTSQEKYAAKAFEYEVVDYLVKPINFTRFEKAVKKALRILELTESSQKDKILFLKTSQMILKLELADITFIEANGDYIQIHTFDKKYTIYSTMSAILKKLPVKQFTRIHRSFIVNDQCVERIEKAAVFIGTQELPIGVSYRKKFIAKISA